MAEQKSVASYYDKSTRQFLRYGHGGREFAIHRAVWGPGTTSRTEAIHYVEDLIVRHGMPQESENSAKPRVIDLGCGVGGSIRYLASRLDADYIGITVSAEQAALSRNILAGAGSSYVIFACDMREIASRVKPAGFTICYAIESFVHLDDPGSMFEILSGILAPGSLVIVCDDFLTSDSSHHSRHIAAFKRGWRAPGLMDSTSLRRIAAASGYRCEAEIDMTAYLEIKRPRDRLISFLLPVLRVGAVVSPWFASLVGGAALQRCLWNNTISYKFLAFRFAPDS